jgi:hypothetical protein
MAELYKFRDDCLTDEGRAKPVKARMLDENFKTVRLELSDSLKSWLKIVQTPGSPDMLDFVIQPPSAEALPVFVGGQFSRWETTEECE